MLNDSKPPPQPAVPEKFEIEMNRRGCLRALAMTTLTLAAGCGSNPGAWSLEQIETELKTKIPASEVKLTGEKGSYSGSAKGTNKKDYKVQVTQDASAGTLNWKAESPDGDELSGNFSQVSKF